MPVPESLPLLTSPPGSALTVVLSRGMPVDAFFRFFFVFFGARKNGQKTDGQKIDFFRKFWRFWCLRRRFLAIFGLKTGPRRLLFRCFFENGDFVKIVLPLWWEHSFGGSDPPKIDPESDSERHRQKKTTKNASGAVSGRTFSPPDPFLVDFWVPAGSQNGLRDTPGTLQILRQSWWRLKNRPDRLLGASREAFGRPPGTPRVPRGTILGRFFNDF